jgi:hypothetical protein
MKVTTTVPTPVPITWHLDLTDDEMADLLGALQSSVSRYSARVRTALVEAGVSRETFARLHARNGERCGVHAGPGDLLQVG